jgi:hypothetical protein
MSDLLQRGGEIVHKRHPELADKWRTFVDANAADGSYSMDAIRAICATMVYLETVSGKPYNFLTNRPELPTWDEAETLVWRHGDAVTLGGLTGFLSQVARLYLGYYYYGFNGKDEWCE